MDKNLHELCGDNVNWLDGKRFSQNAGDEEIREWISGLELYADEVGKFDFENKRVLLNSGYYMPIVGEPMRLIMMCALIQLMRFLKTAEGLLTPLLCITPKRVSGTPFAAATYPEKRYL